MSYIHGHHSSVLSSHRWRTAANSAAYFLANLEALLKKLKDSRPSQPPTLLDVGCGPGTITLDFARILAPYGGHVTGIDASSDVLKEAEQRAKDEGVTNVTFATGDIFNLAFADNTFDAIHTHQVLQHVDDPVQALREKRRVCAPGGLVASREADFSAMAWWPLEKGISDWLAVYQRVARDDGKDPDTGRRLVSLCLAAGFERSQIQATAGTWCYSTAQERAWWGNSWAERVLKSNFAKMAVEKGFATATDLEKYAEAWKNWASSEDAWFVVVHGEVVCQM